MLKCSRCSQTLPKASFTGKQVKTVASKRFCMACTQGAGTTLHALFQAAPAAPAAYVPAAERPSQIVTERTVATTPKGQDVVVTMERLSTGGSRYEARYDHPTSGPMSDSV